MTSPSFHPSNLRLQPALEHSAGFPKLACAGRAGRGVLGRLGLAAVVCGLPLAAHAAPGDLAWARSSLSSTNSSADTRALWVDGNDNTYAVGRFVGTVDLFGTTLTATSTSLASGFIAKFNSAGALQWVRKLGTTGMTELMAVAGLPNGEIFVGGTASLNFSENGVAFNIASTNNQNAVLFKLDASGQVVFGAHYGGSGVDVINAISVIGENQIAIGGYFASQIQIGGVSQLCQGRDGFIAKFDATGTVIDSVFVTGNVNDTVDCLGVDSGNNLVVGMNSTSSSIDVGVPISASGNSIVFAKYAPGSSVPS